MTHFQPIPNDAVISPAIGFPKSDSQMVKASTVINNLTVGSFNHHYYWFRDEGYESEVLSPGQLWQKGKLRIKVVIEFCPDPVVEQ
jgi:hypothetical protein